MQAGRDAPLENQKGFTLVELLLVAVILGIMAGVGMTSYGGVFGEVKLEAAAREIRDAFQYARSQSILSDAASGQEYGVWVALPQGGGVGNWFQAVKGNGTPTPDGIIHPLEKNPYLVDFDNSGYFAGVTLSALSLDVNDQLYFNKRGVPSLSGSVTIQYAGGERTISISRPAGIVAIN